MKIFIRSIVGLVVFLCLLLFWLTRDPTTQLIDASGQELTVGSALDRAGEVVSGSPFEESQALIKCKEFAAAKETLLKVIEESDRDGEAYYLSLYGQARMRIRNEFEAGRAVELLDEFIAGEPDGDNVQSLAHACWRKGNALEQLGRNQDAREAYEESLRWEPGLKLAEQALDSLKE